MGFMHQFGIGARKDFHLAERYYDLAIATSHQAFVPSKLALTGLQIHRIIDGEALPDYMMVIDEYTLGIAFLSGVSFILGTYVLLLM